jgi:hypothetical protein
MVLIFILSQRLNFCIEDFGILFLVCSVSSVFIVSFLKRSPYGGILLHDLRKPSCAGDIFGTILGTDFLHVQMVTYKSVS